MRREHEPLELPTEIDRKFGMRLAAVREAAGVSRFDLAVEINVDESEVEAWELGLIVIYIDELIAVCNVLNVTPDELAAMDMQ
jgi:transcriptional regulator with XRE-family HTH domain